MEGRIPDEGTKAALFEKATTVGIPVRRGEIGEIGPRGFRTDPGDFGRGVYYTTNFSQAKMAYAGGREENVQKSRIRFRNPLVLTGEEAYKLADEFETVLLKGGHLAVQDRHEALLVNAGRLTRVMLEKGHDGLVVIMGSRLEIVDYRPYL